jgi:hypothetical protein
VRSDWTLLNWFRGRAALRAVFGGDRNANGGGGVVSCVPVLCVAGGGAVREKF